MSSPSPQFPVRYRHAEMLSLLSLLDQREAAARLAPLGLTPARFAGSWAVLALAWFRYPDSDIGPYEELSLSIPASGREARPLDLWRMVSGGEGLGAGLLALPVTTPLARDGGREHFGFPKSLEEVALTRDGERFEARLGPKSSPAVSLRGHLPRGLALPLGDLPLLSRLGGQLLSTRVRTKGRMYWSALPKVELGLGDLSHPVAQVLSLMGPKVGLLWAPDFEAALPAPLVIR